MRCSFVHEKQDPAQVISKLVQQVKGTGAGEPEVVEPMPVEETMTTYVWGSGGRLPVFERICPSAKLSK